MSVTLDGESSLFMIVRQLAPVAGFRRICRGRPVSEDLPGFYFGRSRFIRNLAQDLAKFFSGRCHATLRGAGDADGAQFRRSGDQAVNQTFTSHEFENRYAQCDAVSGFHFNEERTITVAFHYDAWFGVDGSENAVEVTMILGKTAAAESDERFGSDLLQGDGFQTSERVRRGHRDTQRVGA